MKIRGITEIFVLFGFVFFNFCKRYRDSSLPQTSVNFRRLVILQGEMFLLWSLDISRYFLWMVLTLDGGSSLSASISWLHPLPVLVWTPEFLLWLSHFFCDLWGSPWTRPPWRLTTFSYLHPELQSFDSWPSSELKILLWHFTDGVWSPLSNPSSSPGPNWTPRGVEVS